MVTYIKRTYTLVLEWTLKQARGKYGIHTLGVVSFMESSFFIIPPDFLLIPLVHSKKNISWQLLALITTITSVLGGLLGYLIGTYLFTFVGEPIVHFYHLENELIYVQNIFTQNAFLAILTAAFTPIPYKLFTIASGLFSVNLFTFILASTLGRGTRFFLVAYTVHAMPKLSTSAIFSTINKNSIKIMLGVIIIVILAYLLK